MRPTLVLLLAVLVLLAMPLVVFADVYLPIVARSAGTPQSTATATAPGGATITATVTGTTTGTVTVTGTTTGTPTVTGTATTVTPTTTGTPAASEATITYTDGGFVPDEVKVRPGGTVHFVNNSSRLMWIASDPHPTHTDYPELNSNAGLANGQTYSFAFTRVGKWGFHNHEFPTHGGDVEVE